MKPAVAALITIIVLGMAATTAYYVWRAHNVVKLIPGVGLSEELGPTPYLTYTEVSKLQPGMVFETTADKQGWQIKQKDTHLYEKLVLSNIDLGVNDVVAWHGYDVFSDGVDDYIVFGSVDSPAESATTDEVSFGARYYVMTIPDTWKVIMSWAGYPDIGLDPNYVWHHLYWNSSRRAFLVYGHSGYGELNNWVDELVVFSGKSGIKKLFRDGSVYTDGSGDWWADINFTITSANLVLAQVHGKLSYATIFTTALSDSEVQNYYRHIVSANELSILFDPTFYNGSTYIELTHGYTATIHGNPTRIPAEHPWLWLVKGLASDNKLHFKWFPVGTIIRIANGNVVREFTIEGAPVNEDGQVEDYAVSLDTATLPGATVEALVPSMHVRVYGPYGATAEIVGEDGTVYGSKVIGPGGYADIPLTHALSNVKVVVCAGKLVKGKLNVRVDEGEDGSLTITVTDDKGVLVPGMLVRVADPSNVVIFAGVTGQDGRVTFKPDRPLPSITVEVSGVWDGAIQYTQKEVRLTAATEAGQVTAAPAASTVSDRVYLYYALMGLGLLILVILVGVMGRRFL